MVYVVWVPWCEDKISYANNGKKHLMRHCVTDKHLERLKVRVTNYRIGGVGPSNQDQGEGKGQKVEKQQNFFSIFKKAKPTTGSGSQVNPQVQPAGKTVCKSAEPLIPISDRTSNTEAMILGYIAEHSLPLSSADSLKNLIQEASRDPQSLSGLSLSKQTASSKMNYGLEKTCTEEIVAKLRPTPFSLSIDEAVFHAPLSQPHASFRGPCKKHSDSS